MARRAARARSAPAETRRRGGAGRAGRGCRCTAAASAAPWCRPHAAGEHAERRCQEPPQRGRLGRRGCDHRWQDESKRSQRKLRRSAGEGRIQRMRFLTRKSLRRPTKRKNFPLRGPSYHDPFMNVRPCQVPNSVAPRCLRERPKLGGRQGAEAARPAEPAARFWRVRRAQGLSQINFTAKPCLSHVVRVVVSLCRGRQGSTVGRARNSSRDPRVF